jgi:hypothetical protein
MPTFPTIEELRAGLNSGRALDERLVLLFEQVYAALGGAPSGGVNTQVGGVAVDTPAATLNITGVGAQATGGAGTTTINVPGAVAGTLAARPAAGLSNRGELYFANDVPAIYISDGSSWATLAIGVAQVTGLYASFSGDAAVDPSGVITLATVPLAKGGTGQITAKAARASTGLNIEARTTVANANYSATATDRAVVYTSLTASRTVTLPAASSLNAGQSIVIKDGSGACTPLVTITVAPNGGDTIDGAASLLPLITAYDATILMSDGTSGWHVVRYPRYYGAFNGQAARTVALPNNVWTMVPLGTELVTDGTQNFMHPLNAASTTVAAGSNGVALPTATINVASTTGFDPSGFLVITGPTGAGIDSVVRYTGGGGGGTQFTGCTLGTGSLATGQVVKPANHEATLPNLSSWNLDGIVTFPAAGNTTGVLGVRFVGPAPFFLAGGTQHIGNPNAQVTVTLTTTFVQSVASGAASKLALQMFQTSGATLSIPVDGIQAPLLGGSFATLR